VLSPRPYKLGESGSAVLKRRYWVSKTRPAAEVSKSVSFVPLRVMVKENGLSVQEKARAELSGSTPSSFDGRGQTDS
jgi:hypothetical protein